MNSNALTPYFCKFSSQSVGPIQQSAQIASFEAQKDNICQREPANMKMVIFAFLTFVLPIYLFIY